MFSVDNFYEFLNANYGHRKTGIIHYVPMVHGSKQIVDMRSYDPDRELFGNLNVLRSSKMAVLHDQEMFFALPAILTYKEIKRKIKNSTEPAMDSREVFYWYFQTISWPIWCHSEQNSRDIDWLEKIGTIPCHYFYHGLIARDWFRHWRHYPDLEWRGSWDQRFLLYARDCTGLREYRKDMIQQLRMFSTEIRHDWDQNREIPSHASAMISREDAVSTAIHLVAETNFTDRKIHLTEKIFKPMVMSQPFILFAAAGSLEYLRNYGFKTFQGIIDESYDLEKDPELRMAKLINLVGDLYKMPQDEFQSVMEQCRPIIEHNRRHFFSDEFEDILLDELHTNYQKAIDEQQQRSESDPGGSLFSAYDSIKSRGVGLSDIAQKRMSDLCGYLAENMPVRYLAIQQQYPHLF